MLPVIMLNIFNINYDMIYFRYSGNLLLNINLQLLFSNSLLEILLQMLSGIN